MSKSTEQRTHAEHEALCRRCGNSCHFAIPINGLPIVIDDLHCRYLAPVGEGRFECTVYEERFQLAPWCRTAAQALDEGLLSQTCLYARDVPGYRGKTRLQPRLLAPVTPAIRAEVLRCGVPIGASKEGILRFLARTGGGTWRLCENEAGTHWRIEAVAPSESD